MTIVDLKEDILKKGNNLDDETIFEFMELMELCLNVNIGKFEGKIYILSSDSLIMGSLILLSLVIKIHLNKLKLEILQNNHMGNLFV